MRRFLLFIALGLYRSFVISDCNRIRPNAAHTERKVRTFNLPRLIEIVKVSTFFDMPLSDDLLRSLHF